MAMITNQVNLPRKGKKLDTVWKVYFKKEGCSMLLFKGLTCSQAVLRVQALKQMYNNWCGTFIVTK